MGAGIRYYWALGLLCLFYSCHVDIFSFYKLVFVFFLWFHRLNKKSFPILHSHSTFMGLTLTLSRWVGLCNSRFRFSQETDCSQEICYWYDSGCSLVFSVWVNRMGDWKVFLPTSHCPPHCRWGLTPGVYFGWIWPLSQTPLASMILFKVSLPLFVSM